VYITAENKKPPLYTPGLDRWSLYKDFWIKHWKGFQQIYNERFFPIYGELSQDKIREVEKLISCGNFHNGFQRHICPECKTQLIVPFTCKSRLCLSCYRRKIFGWSVNLSKILLTSLSHTHITFTIPGTLSKLLFEKNFEAMSMIKLASMLFQREIRRKAGNLSKDWYSGILGTLHKAGNGLNYHPHVHMVATRELINLKTGEISKDPFIPYKRIRILWMEAILRHLGRYKYISPEESKKIKNKRIK
jgi:hypothetical protein